MKQQTSRATPLRVWPGVATFLAWGIGLSFLQWGAERSAVLLWLSEKLAVALGYGLGGMVHLPAQVDGRVVKLYGWAQEVTPNCFGLAAITFLLASVLATPAGWRDRLRGVGLGLLGILVANVLRLVVLSWFFAYAFVAFGFVHIPIWGTVVPLFLVGMWVLWLVRDLHYLPKFPLKTVGLVTLLLLPLLAAWYLVLDAYLLALVLVVNTVLTGIGVPIETVRLASVDLFRYVDIGVPGGGFRIEVAAQTLNLIPFLALTLAAPLRLGRRLLRSLYGVAGLVALHAAGTSMVIVLGWSAPSLVTVFQIVNDFVSLAAGPSLWLLLTYRAAPAVMDARTPARARAQARRAGPAARPAR